MNHPQQDVAPQLPTGPGDRLVNLRRPVEVRQYPEGVDVADLDAQRGRMHATPGCGLSPTSTTTPTPQRG